MPYPNFIGNKRFWTRERVLEGLKLAARDIDGPLPCLDRQYVMIKKGHLEWPSAVRILFYYHSMARAWVAAGAPWERVTLHNQDWLPEEDEYLLEYAGIQTLREIAWHLHRTVGAVHARLGKTHRLHQVITRGTSPLRSWRKNINVPAPGREALALGKIKGRFDRKRNRWEIDLADILASQAAQDILAKPKGT